MLHQGTRMGQMMASRPTLHETRLGVNSDSVAMMDKLLQITSQLGERQDRSIEKLRNDLKSDIQKEIQTAISNALSNKQILDVGANVPSDSHQNCLASTVLTPTRVFPVTNHQFYDSIGQEERTKLEQNLEALPKENHKILSYVEQANEYIKKLEEEKNGSECRERELRSELKILWTKNEKMHHANRELQEKSNTFREIFLRSGHNEGQVDDPSLISLFVNLRNQIQHISTFYPERLPTDALSQKLIPHQRSLFGSLRVGYDGTDLQFQIRAILFTLVLETLLDDKNFGLEGAGNWKEMQSGLAAFEQALEDGQKEGDGHADIIEWRIRTIRCAASLSKGIDMSKVHNIAKYLYKFLMPLTEPISSINDNKEELGEAFRQIVKLCKDATDFTVILRGCKDGYVVAAHNREVCLDSNLAEPQAKEKRRSAADESGSSEYYVAYCIMGAFIKRKGIDRPNDVVLEKAHVVVY
ncbi:hypothetical protein BGZ60DRAFT_434746 [Tricladium varicosporioides]|nr:hypothetical protein BGZ60DRAFT_434746 [Hymenoscyphus varicosporioides]